MIQALQQPVTFDEFVEWLPETAEYHYELHRGVIIEMPKPRGQHSDVAGFLAIEAGIAIRAARLPYFIPKECIVRTVDGASGYEPDAIVLDRQVMVDEPRWERESIITLGHSVKVIVEVVSTNWQDDYLHKLADYEALGIAEYWLVDYAGYGGRRFIGNPKQPTFFVCELVDGEYQITLFRGSDRIVSPTFPGLELTVEQVFAAEWVG
jgi:Uma2 family endonuclease